MTHTEILQELTDKVNSKRKKKYVLVKEGEDWFTLVHPNTNKTSGYWEIILQVLVRFVKR